MIPGYAWSFPLPGDSANVGYGVLRPGPGIERQAGALRGQGVDWTSRSRIREVLGPDAIAVGPWKSWPIPAGIGHAALSGAGGRVLFVGDAAKACDPMTGEGIAQALETGRLAAAAVLEAGPAQPGRAASRYRRQVAWGLAVDDRVSRSLSKVLAHPSGSGRAMRIANRSVWYRGNFARWMFEDYPRAVAVTPHRWKRGLLSSPGAFGRS